MIDFFFDPFSQGDAKFGDFWRPSSEDVGGWPRSYRGHSKPLFGRPAHKSHQIGRSWCQIRGNWSQNLNLVSVSWILDWKCQISKSFCQVTILNFSSVTRCNENRLFWSQKLPNLLNLWSKSAFFGQGNNTDFMSGWA